MYDIPVAFHFKVDFLPGASEEDNRFQEVTGLSAEVTAEEVREGGVNEFAYRLPTGVKYGNLVLKRGLIKDSELVEWCRRAVEDFVFAPKDVLVVLLDEKHDPLVTWSLTRAYPVKWSVSDLKAQENALVVESLELAYQRSRRV
jgi:phage tail-like protein